MEPGPQMALCSVVTPCMLTAPERLGGHGSCLAQEVAIRTVKQSSVVRETENGEEGEEEGAEFGEEDLFHQQVGPGGSLGLTHAYTCTRAHVHCWALQCVARAAMGGSIPCL